MANQQGSDPIMARVDGECQPDQPLTAAVHETTPVTVSSISQFMADDDISDAIAKVLNGNRWHFSTSQMCDEIHSYATSAVLAVVHQRFAAMPDLLAACREFVRKCESGEASSRRSYAQMKAAIAKAEGGHS